MRLDRRALALVAALAALGCGAGGLLAQGVGSIRGKVVEENTLKPLSGVQVTVPGTGRGALTDEAGAYVVSGVPAGAHAVEAEMLGYADRTKSATVSPGQAVTVDFTLGQQAVALNEIVVTGTPGAVQKKTLGNTVTTVNAAEVVQKTGNTNVVEVLAAKTPGLVISGGSGTAGTAQNIKIRGVTSLAAGNQPVVYVDGVKVTSGSLGNFSPNCCADTRSAQSTDALGGVDPNDVQSIEVIKGPAAATLYGADAAAGVIQIITKKGTPGQQKLQWNARVQMGSNAWGVEQPVNYTLCTAAKVANAKAWPGCAGKAVNSVISQDVLTADPHEIRSGAVRNYSLGVKGGGDNYSFYIAGDLDNDQGVLFNNYDNRRSIRSNFAFNPMAKLDFTVNFGYSQQHVALPQNDNSALGLMFNTMLYSPGAANPWGNTLQPDTINLYDNQTTSNQLILGSTVNYRPFSWFRNRLTVGYNSQVSEADLFFPPGRVSYRLGADTTGYVAQQIPRWANYTFDYAGTMSGALRPNVSSDFSFGAQFLASRYSYLFADGLGLSSAFTRLVSNAAKTTGAQSFSESNTLGFFGQEQVGIASRLFLTAGVRMDNSSVFGTDVKRIFYPKLSASYVISDEPWFHLTGVDNLRLRAAWGQAGKAPAPYTATRTYTSAPTTLGSTSVAGVVAGAYGNTSLEPERGTEVEAGLDAGFLRGRAGLEFTYYNKHMTNGLISVPVPPSSGFSGSYYENLLNMTNHGIEASLTASPIQTRNVSWDARLNLATNANKLNSFGTAQKPYFVGYYKPVQGVVPGYPVYGFWNREPRRDASGNLVIVNGVAQYGDSAYVGPSMPTREIGFSNTITLFRNLSLYGLLDYKGGFYQFDVRDWRRALKGVTAEMATATPDPTYAALVSSYFSSGITTPWIQPGDFLKLRDLSATYTFPRSLSQKLHSDHTSFTLAAHNVGILWTRYKGLDPEANFNGADDFYRVDAWTMPMQRQVTASLNVSF